MRAIVVVDKLTRKVVKRFESSVKAAEWFGTSGRNVIRICKEKTLPSEWWYIRFEDEFDPDEDLSGRRGCPVGARNVVTDEKKWFPSRIACANELNIDYRAICRSARGGSLALWSYEVREAGARLK